MCGILAGIVTICLGVAKEVWDKFRGTGFDLMDLAADLCGCVVAVIFSIFM
jgi:VanZ family protein